MWAPRNAAWEEMFAALLRYKKVTGDCNVPQQWQEDTQLAHWVTGQRQLKRKGKLPEAYARRLEQVAFAWDPRAAAWERMFAKLQAFKRKHAHCKVPVGWPEDPQLSNWVINQRQFKKRNQLSANRVQRLDAIGFVWNAGAREARLPNGLGNSDDNTASVRPR